MKKTNKYATIWAAAGHEFASLSIAQAHGLKTLIIPRKDDKAEYEKEAEKIARTMSYPAVDMEIVPFSDRKDALSESWDIAADIKAGTIDPSSWELIARSRLLVNPGAVKDAPKLKGLADNRMNIHVVIAKWLSDNGCGVTAQQQSLTPEVFRFLAKSFPQYTRIFGQHYSKVNDLEAVKRTVEAEGMYLPGLTEAPELLGLRGVPHAMYHNMYENVCMSTGIAGTHTWIMLTMCPWINQVIFYNKKGSEDWQAIVKPFRDCGYHIAAIGFDENTDMARLSASAENYIKAYNLMRL